MSDVMPKPTNPPRRKRTEFRVPPPLLQRIGAKGYPGLDLLEPDADELPHVRILFWCTYRDVELWARVSNSPLFASDTDRMPAIDALDGEIYAGAIPHLRALARLSPGASPDAVSDACRELASWFEGRGRLPGALDFAIAAFLARPSNASFAVRVARLARMLAEYPRATSWFDYSLYLARKEGDWQAYSEACAGYGNMYYQIGNYPRARYFHERCLRVARRNRLREMVGAAHHNLFAIEMEVGNYELAEEHAARAHKAYPPESPCVARLARDLSWRWTIMGHFARALPLALEALNHFTVPVDRALIWADVARAAGGAGDTDTFEQAWAETWVLVGRGVTDPFAAGILLDLGHGAKSIGEYARAARAATKAAGIARERGEGKTILEAEALLDSLHLVPTPKIIQEEPPRVDDLIEPRGILADEIVATLRRARAA